jgi:hypothetical protein
LTENEKKTKGTQQHLKTSERITAKTKIWLGQLHIKLHAGSLPVIWLDWATIQFRFFGHAATYTGSFLRLRTDFELPSSWTALPGYGPNLNRSGLDFMRWPQIDLGAQDLNDIQRPKSFQ